MKTLYHNYFISNFFGPSRLVELSNFSSTPKVDLSKHEGGVEALIEEGDLKKLKAKREELIKLKKKEESIMEGRSLTQGFVKKKVKRYTKMIKQLDAKIASLNEATEKQVANKKTAAEAAKREAEEAKVNANINKLKAQLVECANNNNEAGAIRVRAEMAVEMAKYAKTAKDGGNNDLFNKYADALVYAKNRWKNKDKYRTTEVAGKSSVKKPKAKPAIKKLSKKEVIERRRELFAELTKIKKNAKGDIKKAAIGFNKLKAMTKYKSFAEEIDGELMNYKKENLRKSITIPPKLVDEVKTKLNSKETVGKFLDEISLLKGKQYGKKRISFKTAFLPSSKYNAGLVTRAMQIALGFTGKGIDGRIGPLTIEGLVANANINYTSRKPKATARKVANRDSGEVAEESASETPEQSKIEKYNKLVKQVYKHSDYLYGKFDNNYGVKWELEKRYPNEYKNTMLLYVKGKKIHNLLNPPLASEDINHSDGYNIRQVKSFLSMAVQDDKNFRIYDRNAEKIAKYSKDENLNKYLDYSLVNKANTFPNFWDLTRSQKKEYTRIAKKVVDNVKSAASRDGNYLVA